MTESKLPFWEESYKRAGKLDTFGGGKPGEMVVKAASGLPPGSRALDLGCGEGRNALYLAGLGFQVSATDISQSGIAKLKTIARERKLKIDASVGDMRDYQFSQRFDLIVCEGCLHLIQREDWQMLLKRMKRFTTPGGQHVVGVFTDAAPEPEDQRGLMVGLFKEGELLEQFKDWEILESKAYRFTHTHPDGPTHEHAGNEIIARKYA
ncbi:MAG: methyltransferase domain-containing protein [Dehalococcoidales bacterium]|jgi:tellurite methyltransferase